MAYIAIDETGRVYHVMNFVVLIGHSLDEALENMIVGKWLVKPDFLG